MASFVPKLWMIVPAAALATGAVLLGADPVLAWPSAEAGAVSGEQLALSPVAAAVHVWRETLSALAVLFEAAISLVR
jgi:hypothetical protein